MTPQKAKKLITLLEENGFDAKLYEGYSGRCMFGATTTGVTTDCSPFTFKESFRRYRSYSDLRFDNMGRGFIYY